MNKENIKNIIKAWLLRINEQESLTNDIISLNFGLNDEPYRIELTGSKIYDENDDDWACQEDFEPVERDCLSLEIDNRNGWEEVLELITMILNELILELDTLPILSVKHITTGFCDGDLNIIK